tara:strand:- start:3141 stop:4298 length:1158 start_codon:yes stop_codon:yes gene_type:complete
MKKITLITGSRADYGLLRSVIEGIEKSNKLKLSLIVTGMHLSNEFGLTISEIEKDGFPINKKIEMLVGSDTPSAITKSIGLGMIGFADAFKEIETDLLLVLGDRYEILSAVTSALISRIPVAHLHGGELSEGSIDESIRHSITKMSHLHFVSNEIHRKRVIQLGEQPSSVFTVGALGIDNILQTKLYNKEEIETELNFKFKKQNLLITYHPVTLEKDNSEYQINELIKVLSTFRDTGFIFTMPNSDTNGRIITTKIKDFVKSNSNAVLFANLGQKKYLSCIKYVDAVIGNSSSGLIEVPTFHKPTVNIGDRQKGRIRAKTVIDCSDDCNSIKDALTKALSKKYFLSIQGASNPYGNGGSSQKIINIIKRFNLENLIKKDFYDLNH